MRCHVEAAETRRSLIALLLLAIGAVCSILGFALDWWTVDSRVTFQSNSAAEQEQWSSALFRSDMGAALYSPSEAFEGVLELPVFLVGITTVLGFLGLIASGVLLVKGFLRPAGKFQSSKATFSATIILGVAATAGAALWWPPAWEDGFADAIGKEEPRQGDAFRRQADASWWDDSDTIDDNIFLAYSPGAGWFLSAVGLVILPAIAAVLRGSRRPAPRREPAPHYLPPAPSPPPLPAKTDATPRVVAQAVKPTGPRPRRIEVVSKQKRKSP